MILDRLVKIFTSLKLTVCLLTLGLVLVFWGTLAQVHLGLYKAQNDFFRSFFVFWQPQGSGFRIPIFPGGYTLGCLLIINLFAAHFRYYKPGKKQIGIILIHLGLVLLLLGQLLTDFLAVESYMHIRLGQSKNYSEANSSYELAVVDTSGEKVDKVVAFRARGLSKGSELKHSELPFTLQIKDFFNNSSLLEKADAGYAQVQTTAGIGSGIWWKELPHETTMDRRDMPSGVIELKTRNGAVLGSYLVSAFLARPQHVDFEGRHYDIILRNERFYKPFSLKLTEFRFDRYPGTDIPKNFSSRVQVQRPDTGEDREVLIYMNSPLRYDGETFYQADWDHEDEKGTILQVVRNPSWLTPYLACILVSGGLCVQFLSHLIGFARKRRTK
jgi:hypothetical protein